MIKNKIVNWIRKQVRQAGTKGIVMGLSGGVDSSVVAALSKEALGRNRVLGLILPCHSTRQDLEDAKLVAKKLGIKTETIDLTRIYDNLLKILPPGNKSRPCTQGRDKLALANLKPRLRMLTLYYFANKLKFLVCGTGNKSEIKVGYFTKFGDSGADILPIGDLLKREVRALARELGVPRHIITKPPSAGLWLSQTDEGEMGITYNELDDILERMEKKKKQLSSKGKVDKIREMIKRSEHKRQGPKICYI